jgi:hypothetical protein
LAALKEQEDMAKAAQKERKEAENLRQEEDDRREVDRLIDKYPKNPYMYSTFSEKKQADFNKIQHFTQLTDAHCERRRKLTYDNFPQPPKFYDVTKDTYLKDDCIKDRFDLEAFIPYDLFEEHKKVVDDYVEKKGLAPNNLDARKEIADWKKRFKFYLNKRVALEKELDQEFRKELHHFYSV